MSIITHANTAKGRFISRAFISRATLTVATTAMSFALLALSATEAKADTGTGLTAEAPAWVVPVESRVVTLQNQDKVYTEVQRGLKGAPTFVLVNDLGTEVRSLDTLAGELSNQGYTVIRYAYSGQVENLRLLKKDEEPKFFETGVSHRDLAEELGTVIKALGVQEKETVHLVGVSFGAMIAADYAALHPEKVEAVVLMSPLVNPLDYYDPNGAGLRLWLSTIRFWENSPCTMYGMFNPWLCVATDYWYDSFYNSLYGDADMGLSKQIPAGVQDSTYKKSLFHLLRSARDFDLRGRALRLKNVHMMVAEKENPDLAHDQEYTWKLIDKAERRSFVVVKGAEHDLVNVAPLVTGKWLDAIAQKNATVQKGGRLEVGTDAQYQ